MKKENELIEELVFLLQKGNARVSTDEALSGIPFEKINTRVNGLPYTLWCLTEHLRIAQWDLVEFCSNPRHQSPEWPTGYWPAQENVSDKLWLKCLGEIKADRERMIRLLRNADGDLFTPFPYGTGQNLCREALVLADHNSYHTGEIVVLRRLLGIWK